MASLTFMYRDLIRKGFTEDELKRAINGTKLTPKKEEISRFQDFKQKYNRYRELQSEDAEVKMKNALQALNLPGLIIRSVVKGRLAGMQSVFTKNQV